MSRKTFLKLVALLPWAGPALAKALTTAQPHLKPVYAPYLPAEFPKWNPAIDGLSDAGKWALDFERAGLPDDMTFPRVGQDWVAVRECLVTFRACVDHPAPRTLPERLLHVFGGLFGTARLRQGEQIHILGLDDPDKPLRVTFQPVRYQELHESIVPEGVRNSPGYVGYELSAKTARTVADFSRSSEETYFNEAFRLVGS